MRGAAVLLLPIAVLAGCGQPPPEVTPGLVVRARARWPEASEASLSQGRTTFLSHCGRCHDHPDPARHDEKEWTYYVREMSPRAQLDADEQRDMLRFLIAAHDELAAGQR